MLKNYLKIAWRTLQKNKLYTGLNIFGLSLGLSSFLIILLFVQDELSYDRFLPDSDQIFRVSANWGNAETASYATAPPALGVRVSEDIPEVEAMTRILKWNDFTIQPATGPNREQIFREEKVFYAEPGFFNVFDLSVLAGSKEKALSEPNLLAISASMAQKYFGDVAPQELIGKALMIGSNEPVAREIAVVFEDLPSQSHMHFDMLVFEPGMYNEIFLLDSWTWPILNTYLKFPEDKKEQVQEKLNQIVANYAIPAFGSEEEGSDFNLQLMPIQDIHLKSHLLREMEANGYESYVYMFSLVALFVLLLACINFMNLATAKAGLRSMEVGVRKVMGSQKSQLVFQFLTEAFLVVVVAMVFSLILVQLSNGLFNQISGKELQFNLIQNPLILTVVPVLIIILTFLSGAYPAFYLSSFKPLLVIKQQIGVGKNSHTFRNTLVVFQFATSLTLIICTLLVQRQLSFIQNSNPGFNKEQLLIIHNDGEVQNEEREAFKNMLSSQSQINSVSFSIGIPMTGQFQMRSFNLRDSDLEHGMNWYEADADYLDAYQFELVEGRNFSMVEGADQSKVIINQKAAAYLGIAQDPIGQIVVRNQGENDEAQLEVIGMVEDFNFESYRNEIKPLVIEYMHDYYLRDYISIRLTLNPSEAGIEDIQKTWEGFVSRVPMNYTFFDQDFARMYQSEMKMADLLKVLTFLSVLIACLGLFGLTAYTTHLRTKEIGIRKVFGASGVEIFIMLSSSFLKLVLIAIVLAIPVAVYLTNQWLSDYAYKTGISIGLILLSVLACLVLAGLTIFFQSYQSIRSEPIQSLKDE